MKVDKEGAAVLGDGRPSEDTFKIHGVPEECMQILHPVCHHLSTIFYFSRTKLRYAR